MLWLGPAGQLPAVADDDVVVHAPWPGRSALAGSARDSTSTADAAKAARAEATRLDRAAHAYAVGRRTEALAVGHAALRAADVTAKVVSTASAPVLSLPPGPGAAPTPEDQAGQPAGAPAWTADLLRRLDPAGVGVLEALAPVPGAHVTAPTAPSPAAPPAAPPAAMVALGGPPDGSSVVVEPTGHVGPSEAPAPATPASDLDPAALDAARDGLATLVEQAERRAAGGHTTPPGTVSRADTEPVPTAVELVRADELARSAAQVLAHSIRAERAVEAATAPVAAVGDLAALDAVVGRLVSAADAPAALQALDADLYPNGAIPEGVLCAPSSAPQVLLRCDAAHAFDLLAAAYRAATGRDLLVTSGYRTLAEQEAIRGEHGALAAPPGTSNHGRGIAVDLAGVGGLGQFDTPAHLWLKANAATYGWYHPRIMEPGGGGPQEPWHWEFGTSTGYDTRAAGGGAGVTPRPGGLVPLRPLPRPAVPVPVPAPAP